jgi:hypothetical protein
MIVQMSVSLFENKPECCPLDHQLWPGRAQVSWKAVHLRAGPGSRGTRTGHGTRDGHLHGLP